MFLKVGKNFNGYLDQRTPETMLLESGINIYLYNYLLDVCHTYFVILTLSFVMLKNGQCEHRKIFIVCLVTFQHAWKGYGIFKYRRLLLI